MRGGSGAGCPKSCLFYFYPPRLMPSLLSWGNCFSPQAPKLKTSELFGCPFAYPTNPVTLVTSSSYLAAALFLLPCLRLLFSPFSPMPIPPSWPYMLPQCFSVLVISSVLSLSTPPAFSSSHSLLLSLPWWWLLLSWVLVKYSAHGVWKICPQCPVIPVWLWPYYIISWPLMFFHC